MDATPDTEIQLGELVDLVAEAIPYVDEMTDVVTYSTKGEAYHPGVPSMKEPDFVRELFDCWETTRALARWLHSFNLEVPYPNAHKAKCDAVLDLLQHSRRTRWAVEFKRLQMVGDNGKNNDFGIPKMLSPYLKDRSLRHDAERLRTSGLADRYAVIGYSFAHSFDLVDEALRRHPAEHDRLKNVRNVCHRNDPENGVLDPIEMVHLSDQMLARSGLVADHATSRFEGAWRHPCGGSGLVFGWELSAALQ